MNQKGRSMIEMLGVLAIIGVLSIGGIAGYSKAMSQHKINQTVNTFALVLQNLQDLTAKNVSGIAASDSQGFFSAAEVEKYGILDICNQKNSKDGCDVPVGYLSFRQLSPTLWVYLHFDGKDAIETCVTFLSYKWPEHYEGISEIGATPKGPPIWFWKKGEEYPSFAETQKYCDNFKGTRSPYFFIPIGNYF